jgi:hypothetical protein
MSWIRCSKARSKEEARLPYGKKGKQAAKRSFDVKNIWLELSQIQKELKASRRDYLFGSLFDSDG